MKILKIIGIIFFFFRYIYHAGGAGYWAAKKNRQNFIGHIILSLIYLILFMAFLTHF